MSRIRPYLRLGPRVLVLLMIILLVNSSYAPLPPGRLAQGPGPTPARPAGPTPNPPSGVTPSAQPGVTPSLEAEAGFTPQAGASPIPPASVTPPSELGTAAPHPSLSSHPRLLFGPADVQLLRERAQTTHSSIYAPILAFAQGRISSTPPSTSKCPDLESFRNAGNQLIAFAFVYVISNDPAYLDLTRNYLLAYAHWQYWGDEVACGDVRLGFAHMVFGNAIAFDWIYSGLSPADRATIATNLGLRAQQLYEASSSAAGFAGNWWRRSYNQNHRWEETSALGMAALALQGTDSRAPTWLAHVVDMAIRERALAQGIGDGTWSESIPYQDYMLTLALPFTYALRALTGQDLIAHDYLRNYVYWRTYNYLAGTTRFAMTYGDFDWSWSDAYEVQGVLRLAATDGRDGRAEWLAQQMLAVRGRQASVSTSPWYVFEFLYYDPSIPAQPPDGLPLARTFPDLSGVIWRTGWTAGDLVFGFKVSAPGGRYGFEQFVKGLYPYDHPGIDSLNTGHNHDDSNSFYLYRGDADLSSETVTYDQPETSYHNTLLVDGNGQYRAPQVYGDLGYYGDDPSVYRGTDGWLDTVLTTPGYSYLVGDATLRYREVNPANGQPGRLSLDRFRRYVLFVRPGYFLMVDDLRSSSAHVYDWLAHLSTSVSVEGNWVKGGTGTDQWLGINVLAPVGFATEGGNDGKPYIQVRPSRPVSNTRFAMLLYPTDTAGWNSKPATSVLANDDQMIGVRVQQNGTQDLLIRYGDQAAAGGGGYTLNGQVAAVVRDGSGNLQKILLAKGTELGDAHGTLVRGLDPAMELEADYDGAALALSGSALGGLSIYAPDTDATRVTVNGQPAAVSKDGSFVSLR